MKPITIPGCMLSLVCIQLSEMIFQKNQLFDT